MAAVRLHPALRRAFRILDQDAALREFHEADEGDDDDGAAENEQDDATAHRAFAHLGEELREAARQLRENTGHDNQRHRQAERRVGKECVSTCRSRWSQYTENKKKKT